jgi:hypothetical protein
LTYVVGGILVEKNEMGGACSTYGGEAYTGFWWGNLKERDHKEDLGADGTIILSWIFRMWDRLGMDWINVAQDRDRCRALVNAVMNTVMQVTCIASELVLL